MENALYSADFMVRVPVVPDEIPNKLTVETLLKSLRSEDIHRAKDIDDLFVQLGIWEVFSPEYSGQFLRDVKQAEKRRKDISKLKAVLSLLLSGEPIPAKYKDHSLKGNWSGVRNLHIEPDWLLLYRKEGLTIRFERTGNHSDIFDR